MKKLNDVIHHLKKVLVEAEDFSDIMVYFYDHVCTHPDFMSQGRPKQNPGMMAIVSSTVEQLFGRKVSMSSSEFIFLRKYNLYHGPCKVQGMIGNIFYFTKMKKGMMALCKPGSQESQLMRLTEVSRGEGPVVMHNPAEPATD